MNIRKLLRYSLKTRDCNHSSMTSLMLYNNRIQIIRIIHFRHLLNLTRIFLQGNNIETVPKRVFSQNKKLILINLSYNLITKFFLNINNLPSLKYLDLSVNYITILKQSIFKNYIRKSNMQDVKSLDLSNNSFTCVCDMMWLSNLEELHIINITYVNTGFCIKCLFNKKCKGVGVFNKKNCNKG